MRHWLFKSEPDVFGIEDLRQRPDGTEPWDGVRNYQARNLLRDEIQVGDQVLFYHSNAKPPGIAGLAEVVRAGYPDHTAFDPDEKYFDPKSDPAEPRWYMVDVRYVETFPTFLALDALRAMPELQDMVLLKRSRLSVQPVEPAAFRYIVRHARRRS